LTSLASSKSLNATNDIMFQRMLFSNRTGQNSNPRFHVHGHVLAGLWQLAEKSQDGHDEIKPACVRNLNTPDTSRPTVAILTKF
jgi:hypothetical protein